MIGQVCLEDRRTGRSPSAFDIDTTSFNTVPTCSTSRPIERLGGLCLRHPLPSVVFADRAPVAQVIQVGDTTTALGFDMPMFLSLTGVQRIDKETFLLVGYFFIPVPDHETGALWNHVIQNSHRNVDSITLTGPNCEWTIRYTWPTKSNGPFGWWRRART